MRNKQLEKELSEANKALERGMIARLVQTILIEELIKQHPNPKDVFNDIIKRYSTCKEYITDIADLLEIDLSGN